MAWILDLDGVIWLAHDPIAGSAEAVAALREAGERVLFVTNFSALTVGEHCQRLSDAGVAAEETEIVSSALAAGELIEAGQTVLVCGGAGVSEAVERRGATVVADGQADAVIVGFHREFDFERLAAASAAVRGGATLIATNSDPTYPTPEGLIPGNGALVAAVETAGKAKAVVAGKPHEPIAQLVRDRAGDGDHLVVGDLPATDGLLAQRLGARFGLVLSGVTTADQLPVEPAPDVVADELATLVAAELH